MDNKSNKLIIASAIMMSLSMATTVSAAGKNYAGDGGGLQIMDGSGDCVVADSGKINYDCEDPITAQPIPQPVMAQPITKPIPPKPVVIPPPAPRYVTKTLSLNEAGGANFGFDKDNLSDGAQQQLAAFATAVKAGDVKPSSVSVIGHTDSIGSEKHNQTLSEKRANSVASYLSSQGIDSNIMQVSGRGESQAVADNKSKAGRAQNRRVDIQVTGQRQVQVKQ